MCEEKYNGWENYETWCVFLWIGNEPYMYHRYKEASRETEDKAELARGIRDEFMQDAEELNIEGCFRDLLTHSLKQVNWMEIAEALKEA